MKTDINTQYLLDQVARLTAENAMLKEKWLAQPEQEPVGYLYKQMDCTGEWATIFKVDKPYITWHDIKDIVPVYTAPKREPLSDEEIVKLWANKSPANEFECVRLVEQAHGIGGGE